MPGKKRLSQQLRPGLLAGGGICASKSRRAASAGQWARWACARIAAARGRSARGRSASKEKGADLALTCGSCF